MEIYAYADETEFQKEVRAQPTSGSAILYTSAKIQPNLICEALQNLANDPLKNHTDIKTLLRKNFHASKDGPRAKFQLCQVINKHISGKLKYSNFEKHHDSFPLKQRNTEETQRLALSLASNEFFSNRYTKVNLIIEQRMKFNQRMAEEWLEHCSSQYELQTYQHTSFITYYPAIEVHVENKSEPGLQIVDFLLWSLNRSQRLVPDNSWRNALNLRSYSTWNSKEGPQSGGYITLNEGVPYLGRLHYPALVNNIKSYEFFTCYINIEKTVRLVAYNTDSTILHFKSKLSNLEWQLNSGRFDFDIKILLEICSLYIRIFDTMPVYDSLLDSETQKWELLLKSKKLAGLLIRTDLNESINACKELIRWRASELQINPNLFNL